MRHPDDQPVPVLGRQRQHQQQARQDAEDRDDGTNGTLNGRGASGFVYRITSTAPHTTANANSVPMFVSSSSTSSGRSPAMRATKTPTTIVPFHGVLNVGWMVEKNGGSSPSRRHGHQHAGRTEQTDEHHRGEPGQSRRGDHRLRPRHPDLRERLGDRGLRVQLVVLHHPGQHDDHTDVEDRADEERPDDSDGHVACGLLGLLGLRGDGVEADVREEDDGGPGDHADRAAVTVCSPAIGIAEEVDPGPPVGRERFPVRRVDERGPDQRSRTPPPRL